jgi:hydrogenase/urease accessory protein HupE
MKPFAITLTTLTASLTSAAVSAHIGEHHQHGLMSGLIHLLTEHALPIGVIALVAGGLLIKRLLQD